MCEKTTVTLEKLVGKKVSVHFRSSTEFSILASGKLQKSESAKSKDTTYFIDNEPNCLLLFKNTTVSKIQGQRTYHPKLRPVIILK